MRFLLVTTQREAAPPEMVMPLLQAMKGWLAEHRGNGRLVDVWGFAGGVGGGGIIEVNSHEELDAVMVGFPFAPFSHIEIYALSDLDAALELYEATITQMMEAMA